MNLVKAQPAKAAPNNGTTLMFLYYLFWFGETVVVVAGVETELRWLILVLVRLKTISICG